eukprot:CAMPEP_0113502544 /NCGR_PEP_ID=MMETSP0014_2-20120614/33625_1 /TAXON_ID=2857 /ORGANISM="Nitzschia sp." /LENGTH=253 /DNA_ID=CAMNT_0000397367 /DNA_START=105 /DNA_END=869 /DNA_ORIENTATION=+ /assembly_acc=CAM_ASM_000159
MTSAGTGAGTPVLSRRTTFLASSTIDDDTTSTEEESAASDSSVDERIAESLNILYRAAETKSEDSDKVVDALLDLEKLQRQKNKADPTTSDATLDALSGNGGGSWRLIFTTGTIDTQKKTGTRINYFPVKATQSFKKGTDPWYIENGIYLGDFPVIKFSGDFDWTLQKSGVTKLTFDFSALQLFGTWDITLKKGEAAGLGAKSGLGSENNVKLEEQGKRAFFNWISADEKIATARGGGGGLALWKRVDYEGAK